MKLISNICVFFIFLGIMLLSHCIIASAGDCQDVTISTPVARLNCTLEKCPIIDSEVIDNLAEPPYTYQWYNGTSIITGATGSSFEACYPGTYHVNVTDSTGFCEIPSNTLEIYPEVYPQVIISTSTDQLNCTGPCPVIRSTVTDGPGPFSYKWFNYSAEIEGATGRNLTVCHPGSYSVLVTNTSSECASHSDTVNIKDVLCNILKLTKKDDTRGHPVSRGQIVTYVFTVKNTWNLPVKDIRIVDDRLGVIVEGITLEPNEERSFTKSVKFDDSSGMIVCNTAKVYGNDTNGIPTESVSDVHCLTVSRPSIDEPIQYGQFCEAQKVAGTGVVASSTSIVDRNIGLEYNNAMSGDGDLELDQEHAYSQNSVKLKRNISSVNDGNQSNLNLFETSKMTYSGEKPLVGEKYLNSRALFGGIGADIQEAFSVNEMEKEQTTFFSGIPNDAQEKGGSSTFIGQLKDAGRNIARVAEIMGNNSAHLIGIDTKSTFNGTWGTDARWHKIFFKDIASHERFTGKFEAEKLIKFHQSPVPENRSLPCEGIDC